MKRNILGVWIAVTSALACGSVHAQLDRGWYGGLSYGQSKIKFDRELFATSGALTSTLTTDYTDNGFKLFAGYRMLRNVAFEAGFTDFGTFSAERTFTAPAAGTVSATIKSSGFHFDAVGILPIDNFDLFGKLGFIYTTTKADGSASGAVTFVGPSHAKKSEFNPKAGLGAEYRFSRSLGLRAEYERAFGVGDKSTMPDSDIDMISVGLTWRF